MNIQPIGVIATPFKQKFAIPRQPNLANASGRVTFDTPFDDPQAFKGLEGFSHVWLLFHFHATARRGWKLQVKAPRLGGNNTLGVFATRSTHRPNGIGMSVVKNEGLHTVNGRICLDVSGVDLLDQTPIVDIKPYLPYADRVDNATDRLTEYQPIPERTVHFSPMANLELDALCVSYPDARTFIRSILSQDPRPAYKQHLDDDAKIYRVALFEKDISWCVRQGEICVLAIENLP
ncbi:tRNA (N6-threonylcarbamoyladenosine(37)-N6)-methyltransferase TrmO [Aestuariibacter sp. A3R04]|uniref:tRNA (N6-threonylcarbamoyladenosine(37)-N6)-methyltransferase TrmO n=1 Tax=Aestuariibacter sp. A3R04 TaxID=2841571 RepID=UPI00352E4BE8